MFFHSPFEDLPTWGWPSVLVGSGSFNLTECEPVPFFRFLLVIKYFIVFRIPMWGLINVSMAVWLLDFFSIYIVKKDVSAFRFSRIDKLLRDLRSRGMKYNAYICSSTSKAWYELKVVLHLWRVNLKTIRGFINIPLADLSHINLRHYDITILLVGRDNISITYRT